MTFEQDPNVSIGVPVWSKTGRYLAFIVTRNGLTGLNLVEADGSGLREIVANGIGAAWSGDDRWLYYGVTRDGSALYFTTLLTNTRGVSRSLYAAVADIDSDIVLFEGLRP